MNFKQSIPDNQDISHNGNKEYICFRINVKNLSNHTRHWGKQNKRWANHARYYCKRGRLLEFDR